MYKKKKQNKKNPIILKATDISAVQILKFIGSFY